MVFHRLALRKERTYRQLCFLCCCVKECHLPFPITIIQFTCLTIITHHHPSSILVMTLKVQLSLPSTIYPSPSSPSQPHRHQPFNTVIHHHHHYTQIKQATTHSFMAATLLKSCICCYGLFINCSLFTVTH